MEPLTAFLLLLLVMDPLGNIVVFTTALRNVPDKRRPRVIARESLIALAILIFFLLAGPLLMSLLDLTQPALELSGGVLLFVISIGMVFPKLLRHGVTDEATTGSDSEPFIVPLATPFIAGPSAMAVLLIHVQQEPGRMVEWFVALLGAWLITTTLLLSGERISRFLGHRGLTACERLMGMLLIVIAIQMSLNGVEHFLSQLP